ncbi:unnamed protein product [Gadus morhua 'NCC']
MSEMVKETVEGVTEMMEMRKMVKEIVQETTDRIQIGKEMKETVAMLIVTKKGRESRETRRVSIITMGCYRRALRHALAGLLLALLSPASSTRALTPPHTSRVIPWKFPGAPAVRFRVHVLQLCCSS